MIEIADGDAGDIAAIMPIMDDAFDPSFGEAWTAAQCLSALSLPDCRLLLGKNDTDVVGFAISRWVLDTEELLMIGVANSWQRRKVGNALLCAVANRARQDGRKQLFLEVRDGNTAQDFYTEFGFRPIGRRKQYYRGFAGFRPDAITMTLDL